MSSFACHSVFTFIEQFVGFLKFFVHSFLQVAKIGRWWGCFHKFRCLMELQVHRIHRPFRGTPHQVHPRLHRENTFPWQSCFTEAVSHCIFCYLQVPYFLQYVHGVQNAHGSCFFIERQGLGFSPWNSNFVVFFEAMYNTHVHRLASKSRVRRKNRNSTCSRSMAGWAEQLSMNKRTFLFWEAIFRSNFFSIWVNMTVSIHAFFCQKCVIGKVFRWKTSQFHPSCKCLRVCKCHWWASRCSPRLQQCFRQLSHHLREESWT